MTRSVRRSLTIPIRAIMVPLVATISVSLVAACGSPAATASPQTASPVAVASNTVTISPTPIPIAVKDGEPWQLYAWYLPGKDTKDLFLMRPDGTDAHPIATDLPGEHTAPGWSSDGQRIAFVVRDDTTPNGSIWTAAADGTGASLLYDGAGACAGGAFHPRWSPDGSRIAFVCYVDDLASTIAVLDPTSKTKTELVRVSWPEFFDNAPSWSHDGQTLAFDTLKWDPTNQFVIGSLIATVPAAGGKIHRLTAFDSFAAAPDWSPDDTLLAFNTYDIGNMHGIEQPSNVYSIHPDGTHQRQLTTASTDGKMRIGLPRWSADGNRLWVGVTRESEVGPSGQPKAEEGWVDPKTGELHELHVEGKGSRPRPTPPSP